MPPGEARETRLAEALTHAVEAVPTATVEALQGLWAAATGAPQEALQRLLAWTLTRHIEHALLPMQRDMTSRQRSTVCLVDEEPIPLRAAFAAMATETRRDRRAAIEVAVVAQLRDLNALYTDQFKALSTVVEPLGYAAPEAFWATNLPVEPATLQDVATAILTQTEEVYTDLLTWATQRRLRMPPGQLRRHDIFALFTFSEYQAYYQPGSIMPALHHSLRELGLAPDVDGRLTWRERAAAFGPPAALALQIPDEIVLSYGPAQGLKGAEALASASGQGLLWAHTAPELPLLSRALGDPALALSQGYMWAELMTDPRWLAHALRVRVDRNYMAWHALDRLYRIRRFLGRFLYTRYLYTENSLSGADEAYRDLMMEACHVDYPQEYYLLDWDWDYTSLMHLRAWSLALALCAALRAQYADDWFRNPEAGEWLRQYWASALGERLESRRDDLLGTSWDADLFAAALGYQANT